MYIGHSWILAWKLRMWQMNHRDWLWKWDVPQMMAIQWKKWWYTTGFWSSDKCIFHDRFDQISVILALVLRNIIRLQEFPSFLKSNRKVRSLSMTWLRIQNWHLQPIGRLYHALKWVSVGTLRCPSRSGGLVLGTWSQHQVGAMAQGTPTRIPQIWIEHVGDFDWTSCHLLPDDKWWQTPSPSAHPRRGPACLQGFSYGSHLLCVQLGRQRCQGLVVHGWMIFPSRWIRRTHVSLKIATAMIWRYVKDEAELKNEES